MPSEGAPKVGDDVTFLGMNAKVIGVDGAKVSYRLGSAGVVVTVDESKPNSPKGKSRAAPGTDAAV